MPDMSRKLVERRKRGIFGWLFILVFWGWNALMAVALLAGVGGNASQYAKLTTEAERQGYAAGTGLGIMVMLMMWAAGAVVFGLLAYFTRGRRELVEVVERAK